MVAVIGELVPVPMMFEVVLDGKTPVESDSCTLNALAHEPEDK